MVGGHTAPLPVHLLHLRQVVGAGEVEGVVPGHLGQGASVRRGDRLRFHTHHHVLLTAERVVCPVGRTGPDVGGVSDDVLVVHEGSIARYAAGRDVQTVDALGGAPGRTRVAGRRL